jgi:hypothetical protein
MLPWTCARAISSAIGHCGWVAWPWRKRVTGRPCRARPVCARPFCGSRPCARRLPSPLCLRCRSCPSEAWQPPRIWRARRGTARPAPEIADCATWLNWFCSRFHQVAGFTAAAAARDSSAAIDASPAGFPDAPRAGGRPIRGCLVGRIIGRRGVLRRARGLFAGCSRLARSLLVGLARGAHAGLRRTGRGGGGRRRHTRQPIGVGCDGLAEGLDGGQRAALDFHALDRAVQHAQVDVEPLLDGLEVGNALVEFIDVHGRCEAAGQVEAGPGLFHQVDRIEHIAQRPQSERTPCRICLS